MRTLKFSFVLLAWLLATGSHWDLVQTFGWGRMMVQYARTMSVQEAVRLTFTPDNMCSICETVQEAKQQEAATPVGKWQTKMVLVFEATPVVAFSLAPTAAARAADEWVVGQERPAPGVPPPKWWV